MQCDCLGLVFRGLTPQQQPGSYQGGEMMMKSVFWWRKPEHPEETTDLRQVTDETCLVNEVAEFSLVDGFCANIMHINLLAFGRR